MKSKQTHLIGAFSITRKNLQHHSTYTISAYGKVLRVVCSCPGPSDCATAAALAVGAKKLSFEQKRELDRSVAVELRTEQLALDALRTQAASKLYFPKAGVRSDLANGGLSAHLRGSRKPQTIEVT